MSCDYCWPGNCCGGPNCLAAIEEDPRESLDPEVRAEAIKAWGPLGGAQVGEVRDVEEIVKTLEVLADWSALDGCKREVLVLIADWRAKKAALEKIVMHPQGSSPNEISSCLNGVKWIARAALHGYPASGQDPPPPPQSMASPADSRDGQA